jgi:hypothetical protein
MQALPLPQSEHERSCKPTQPLLRRGKQGSSTILTLDAADDKEVDAQHF